MDCFDNKENVIIGIIDSGLDISIIESQNDIIFGGHVVKNKNSVYIQESDYYDQIGHGTAIYSIINKKISSTNKVKYVIIKIFDNDLLADVECLVCAIDKCCKNKCDIINISAVITNENKHLEEACKKAYESNINIVAAESNFPSNVVFPARYKTCYGVKAGKCHGLYDYYFDDSAASQFIARGDEQRISWLNQTQLFMGGASFAAAHVTAFIALAIQNNKHMNRDDLNKYLKVNSLNTPPPLVSLSQEAKFNLFIDSNEMKKEAVYFLNWNKHNKNYKNSIVLSKDKCILGNHFSLTDDVQQIDLEIYDSILVARDYYISDYDTFEDTFISKNKYLYYLYPDYKRKENRKNRSSLIDDFYFNFDDIILKKYIFLERHLLNYIIKAPVLGVISTEVTNGLWNKAYTIKSLFKNEGYHAVIFDTTSHTNVFGAEASCCCSYEGDLAADYSNYKRILTLFIKCLDYHYCPDIIIVIGRISLTKDTLIDHNPNSIVQSCAFIFACLIEAFVAYDNNLIIDNKYIKNLEAISKGKFIGTINEQNILDVFYQIKAYFS